MWLEKKLVPYLSLFLLYVFGERVMHGLVISETIRETQLEADQIAAQQIQKTRQPVKLEELAGYEMEVLRIQLIQFAVTVAAINSTAMTRFCA